MKKLLMGAVALGAMMAGPALAQTATGYQAGDLLVHLRATDVIPENFSSKVSVLGGHVQSTQDVVPEIDGAYFITPNWSAELIAATSRHEISAHHTVAGKVDVGSVWCLPPTLTAQYHFSQVGAVRPYAGVGLTVAFFYDSHAAGPTVTKVGYSTGVGPTLDAGFDYALSDNFSANVDVKQMFVSTRARINGAIVAKTALDPTVVSVGIGYLF